MKIKILILTGQYCVDCLVFLENWFYGVGAVKALETPCSYSNDAQPHLLVRFNKKCNSKKYASVIVSMPVLIRVYFLLFFINISHGKCFMLRN